MNSDIFEEQIFPQILANEVTCRLFLMELQKRGCGISVPIEKLTHEGCQTAAIRIYATLLYEEKKKQNKEMDKK